MADAASQLAELHSLAQAGDLARAALLAETLITSGQHRDPLPYRVLGAFREMQGRLAEAAAAFGGALRIAPDHLPTLTAYGQCRARLGQLDEAEGALQRAVALDDRDAAAQFALGWTLENRGEVEAALTAYARAAALDPLHAAARANAAGLAVRRGRWSQARAHAEAALHIAPNEASAQIALAQAQIGEQQPEAAESRLRALLAAPIQASAHALAVARAVLGDALHAQSRPDEAFAEWTLANAALRAQQEARFAAGREERGAALASRLLAAQAPGRRAPWIAAPPAKPGPAAGHAFVVGFPRSGTTLLGQVLGSHPQITALDEVELLSAAARRFLGSEAGLAALDAADAGVLAPYRDAYWRAVERKVGTVSGRLFVDKLPTYLLGLPLLARLFPDAKLVVVRRDPRDVVLSCFRHLFVINPSTFEFLDLADTARFFDVAQRLVEQGLASLPVEALIVRHEALVDDFDGQAQALCRFLELPWQLAMRDFAAQSQARAVRTVSSAQVGRGLNRDGIGTWRPYREQLAPVLPILAPWVRAWGYPDD
ncbi:tetratricopeptide repeat-containing sulfotransferase family protein [Nevskia sp.]|uniref:tetratricopeptide repeat-containing sulfotransferase family protein n=1 Tax=Nevskia sp. TaxID=1929292 RepID=UPI0025D31330|nr:tetratricopeptide repeat-containing sulfotransferase family protein [Nevskia sp.]